MPRYAAKRDGVEKEIIEGLRAAGYSVEQIDATGLPDLLVGSAKMGFPLNILLEVKERGGTLSKKLTVPQIRFFDSWSGQAAIVTSFEEALDAITAYERGILARSYDA